MYVSAIKPCKCPLCCLPVTNLVPDMSLTVQPGEDVEELIRKVQHYNQLFAGGMYALFLWMLTFFYGIEEYGFFSSGKFGMRKIFDFIVSMMLASLLLYNIWQRWELRGLERRLAALQEQNAWADLQEREALDDLQVLANLQPQDA